MQCLKKSHVCDLKIKTASAAKSISHSYYCKNKLFSSSFVYVFVVVFIKKLTEQCPCKSVKLNIGIAYPSKWLLQSPIVKESLPMCFGLTYIPFPTVLGVTSQSPSPSKH